ncbi:hypothetical protein Q8F55_003647 [Vanrija albida]|uniref:Hyaluronan/mRNA-binding protein domain-containing protein n=1 Tax=Vanrija albida TaxID=181172 RepID=A0ABR3Q5C2_9TREE
MTRTERNNYPAAVLKDRHSRAGLNKSEMERKGGAGVHNWGSFAEEENLEYQGDMDARLETAMFEDDDVTKDAAEETQSADTEDSAELAELGSTNARPIATGQRRLSQVTDEEREAALRYREGGLKQNGVDLASIARTSYGVAQSPTNSSVLSTSPLRTKAGFSAQTN